MKKNSGQAMAEFVIVIPILLVLCGAVFQISMILIDRIKLAQVERDVFMFTASRFSSAGVEEFAKVSAKNNGLNPENLSVTKDGDEANGPQFLKDVGKMFTGTTIELRYTTNISKLFGAVLDKETAIIKSKIYTGAGGNMKIAAEKNKEFEDKTKDLPGVVR